MKQTIQIFDTTLRDGEQSPGASMSTEEKLMIARQLLHLKVDAIEAGFPVSSPGDFESVRRISQLVGNDAVVCALSRAVEKDIVCAADALKHAKRPRIHTGIGVSKSHLEKKLHLTEEECIKKAVHAVSFAKSFVDDVQFYPEDAGRADKVFLARIVEAVIAAGATVINIPDTTGYNLPEEYGKIIAFLKHSVKGIDDITLSVHCHNDLGLATALALAGVRNGATQVECTINGLGERAGNTALEEIVMALNLHSDLLNVRTNIVTQELSRTSRLVSQVTGMVIQPNKAIVGSNAFAHSSGIHQDGILKSVDTYQVVKPEQVGIDEPQIVLSARSGHAALNKRIEELGCVFDKTTLDKIYKSFLEIADRKKEVYDEDLFSLIHEYGQHIDSVIELVSVQTSCGTEMIPTATVTLKFEDGRTVTNCNYGIGPVDAIFKTIAEIIEEEFELIELSIQSVTQGIDALGKVTVRIKDSQGVISTGRGLHPDITVSSAKAYVNALNRLSIARKNEL